MLLLCKPAVPRAPSRKAGQRALTPPTSHPPWRGPALSLSHRRGRARLPQALLRPQHQHQPGGRLHQAQPAVPVPAAVRQGYVAAPRERRRHRARRPLGRRLHPRRPVPLRRHLRRLEHLRHQHGLLGLRLDGPRRLHRHLCLAQHHEHHLRRLHHRHSAAALLPAQSVHADADGLDGVAANGCHVCFLPFRDSMLERKG